ncbi:uncharacterized protein ACWYII_030833 [Salvelinus alpinus]
MSFLGYIIAQGQSRMDPAKVMAVTEWPAPSNLKQLQRFLGYIIAQGQSRMDSAKVMAVTEWPAPSNLKQLQRFLGYIIAQGQSRMDPPKVMAVTEWPAPSNLKQLQRFLGFANFYRRFIRNYSRLAAPLTTLTSTPFHWTPEAEAAFLELKRRFTSAPVLTLSGPELQFIVEVDASDTEGPPMCIVFL